MFNLLKEAFTAIPTRWKGLGLGWKILVCVILVIAILLLIVYLMFKAIVRLGVSLSTHGSRNYSLYFPRAKRY